MGLLYNQEGNIKMSADFLSQHFELLRQDDIKVQKNIDAARVNLGIV